VAAVALPCVVSLIVLRLLHSGSSGSALVLTLVALASVLTFVPLVLYGAALIGRMERERLQSEQELRISTQRYSSVVASAMDAIITLDESQSIIVFNEAAERMFGAPACDVLGKPLDRFLPMHLRQIHQELVRNFGETGVTRRSMSSPGILSAVRANGEEFPIEATISHVQVAGQKLYTVVLRDITERKRAQETLLHSEARFRSIYEQAAVGIEQVSLDGKLLMVNAAFCRMLGYEESELLGKRISEITDPGDYAQELESFATQIEHRRPYEVEKRYRHRDGSLIWVHVTSSVVYSPAGEPQYRISVVQDLSERKRTEEQLKQSLKMEAVGRLAGGVAHDFNTLLNVMLGYSELLLAELPEGDARRDRVLQIKNSCDAGAMLTKQLLAFSRKQAIAEEVLDLREITSRMTPMVGRLLRDDIVLTVKCSDRACPVKVDSGQIQQLILNLVSNAADAMPDGGRLDIEVKDFEVDESCVQQHPNLSAGTYAMISISDTGIGMNAQTMAHIFEPFFTTKEVGKGTGLGLSTVYGIVKRISGDVWAYSEPGAGTVFKILLPFTTEELQPAEPEAAHTPSRGGAGQTILLVEDSVALREMTNVILVRDGYNVLQAEDGVAALELSKSYPGIIHLVLTDVVMPRMRGPILAKQLLKQRPGIAVVFMSGYTEEVISESEGLGGATLVEKPYTAETLLRAIQRALDESSSRSALRAC